MREVDTNRKTIYERKICNERTITDGGLIPKVLAENYESSLEIGRF